MRIQRRRNEKLNNAGMSLVEIVVAMFILAAVTATILSIFVYSIQLNARSRTRQQTTAAAQTVMEDFKAYSVQEIGEKFATGTYNGYSAKMVNPADGSELTAPVPGGNTNFQILGMKYQNEYYDVQVELTGHSLQGRTADIETLIYENRTPENSAAYVGYVSMDAEALSKIADEVAILWTNAEAAEGAAATPTPGPTSEPSGDPDPPEDPAPAVSHTGSEVDLSQIKITQRVLTVTVKKDDADNCVAEVGCTYYFGGNDYQYGVTETGTPKKFHIDEDHIDFDLDGSRTELTKEIFNQPIVDNKVPLENLTIYYYPAYKQETAVKILADKIVIDIGDGIPGDHEIRCYIYKQRNLAISDAKISAAELAYQPELVLDTNANIYDDNLDTILGSPTSVSSFTYTGGPGTSSPGERYHGIGYAAKNMDYPGPGATPAPAMPTAMPAETVENLRMMYDITISVYRKDDLLSATPGTPLSVLKGTIIE